MASHYHGQALNTIQLNRLTKAFDPLYLCRRNTHTYIFWPIQWRAPWGLGKTNLGHTFSINITLLTMIFYSYTYPIRPWLTCELYPLLHKVPMVAVMLTPWRRCMPPWTSYASISRHYRVLPITSDNTNTNSNPYKRCNCWILNHSQIDIWEPISEGSQTPIVDHVWYAQWPLRACHLHQYTYGHHRSIGLHKVQYIIWHLQGRRSSMVYGFASCLHHQLSRISKKSCAQFVAGRYRKM